MTTPRKSRFADLLEREGDQAEEYLQPEVAQPTTTPLPSPEGRKLGRPSVGKRSNPEYKQATVFIRKDLRRQIERILFERDTGEELSDVIEDALTDWLKKNS